MEGERERERERKWGSAQIQITVNNYSLMAVENKDLISNCFVSFYLLWGGMIKMRRGCRSE